jgi:hypothetical protein
LIVASTISNTYGRGLDDMRSDPASAGVTGRLQSAASRDVCYCNTRGKRHASRQSGNDVAAQ